METQLWRIEFGEFGVMGVYDCEPPDGLNQHCNGVLTGYIAAQMGFGKVGCAFRGTLTCLDCPFTPLQECDWHCSRCDARPLCKCGQTGQEARVARWLGLGIEEE